MTTNSGVRKKRITRDLVEGVCEGDGVRQGNEFQFWTVFQGDLLPIRASNSVVM